jgi:hypothetical protein
MPDSKLLILLIWDDDRLVRLTSKKRGRDNAADTVGAAWVQFMFILPRSVA